MASRTSGRTLLSKGRCSLPRGGKRVPSTHKKVPPFLRAQNKTMLGIESTTCWYNFNPMVTFYGGLADLRRGIGHMAS
jgi:hypothetical protein